MRERGCERGLRRCFRWCVTERGEVCVSWFVGALAQIDDIETTTKEDGDTAYLDKEHVRRSKTRM